LNSAIIIELSAFRVGVPRLRIFFGGGRGIIDSALSRVLAEVHISNI